VAVYIGFEADLDQVPRLSGILLASSFTVLARWMMSSRTTELKSRMAKTHGLAERVVGVEPADAHIVAKVKEQFGLAR